MNPHNVIWPEPFHGIDRTELDQSEASNFQITRIVLYWVYYMWLLCLHAECIIQWPCSNLAQTLLKLCSNFAQTSLKVRSNLAQISLKPHSNLTQTSLKPHSNLTQTSLTPRSNLAQWGEVWASLERALNELWARFEQDLSELWATFERGLSEVWARFEQALSEVWARFERDLNKVQQTNVIHYIHWISVLVLSVSLSAYMKNAISVFYRYRPIRKLSLSGFISIGWYEKFHGGILSVSADKKIEFIGLYGYGSYTDPRCTFLLQNGKKDRITKMSVKLWNQIMHSTNVGICGTL